MEIVLKLARKHRARAQEVLANHVARALPAGGAKIDPVFPGLTEGNRSCLFTVKLPKDTSREILDRLLTEFRDDAAIEYANLPVPKQSMKAQG